LLQQIVSGQGFVLIMMEHQGIRWGYVFLRAPNFLNNEDRNQLMAAAVEMYLAGETERDVASEEYEGRLYTQQRFEMLGEFGGQRFDVDLETPFGRDTATFLVNEQTGGYQGGLGFSRN
jgi:hypothetical protein